MIRVLLVDDQRLMRDGLATLLTGEVDLSVVGTAADGEQAIALLDDLQPDVILMDMRMPVLDGIAATGRICASHPHIKVLILTTFDDIADVTCALAAGAVGYLLKDMPAPAIAASVRAAAQGGAVLPPELMRSILTSPGPVQQTAPLDVFTAASEPLTDRELDVLRCLAEGYSNREIARRLFVSEGTVKNHVSSIIAKLGLRDRTQAALFAVRHGLGGMGDSG